MAENATEERLKVAVEKAPLHDKLSPLLRNKGDQEFLTGIFGGDGIVDPNDNTSSTNERAEAFERLLQRQYPNFEDLKLRLQKKALKATLEEFRQTEAFLERLEEERKGLSPAARARLEAKTTISDSTLSAKKREAELKVFLRDEGKGYRDLKKQAKIGGLDNLFHATVGRYVFAPLHRYIGQPIMSISETQKKQRGPFWTMVGLGALAVLGAAAVVGSGGLLIGAIAAGGGWGLAMPCIGLAASSLVTWKAGKNIPEAYENWQDVREIALSEQQTRDKAFEAKNDAYRDGYTPEVKALELSPSLIRMKGFNESDFQGRAGSLDVATGRFLMSKQMFLKYNGAADIAFNRSTGELLIALKNTDGRTAEQNAEMIEEIVLAATGRDVGKSVVFGKPCSGLDGMKAALKEKDELRYQGRLQNLEKDLNSKLDDILSESLVTPIPETAGTKGYAPFVGIAAKAMEVSGANDAKLYGDFTASIAPPILNNAISELTGKKISSVTDANIREITIAIMANAIPNYEKLTENQQKLALVKVALGGAVPEKLAAFGNTVITAAAIEASRLGVTEKQIQGVVGLARDAGGQGNQRNHKPSDILEALGIERSVSTNNRGNQLKRFESGLMETAQNILDIGSATSMPDSRAFQVVAAQRDVVNA